MDTVTGWDAVPKRFERASLAIGNFDGVHRGHKAVLSAALAKKAPGHAMGAMVFEPYPRKYFQPNKPLFRLTTLDRKLDLLAKASCDFTAIIPFNATVAAMSADAFIETILVKGYRISHAAVGYNFFFGENRTGTPAFLLRSGQSMGFDVTVVQPQGDDGEIFSSTRVRELLAEGDVSGAAHILGYFWRIDGFVESGAGRGQGLGFPTANIRLAEGVSLKHGIYAVHAMIEGRKLQGAAYLGTRPTFDAGQPLLETFLFDFDGDLYGKRIEVEFVGFVRDDAKFRSGSSLAAQMAEDCAKAKAMLDALPKSGMRPNQTGP